MMIKRLIHISFAVLAVLLMACSSTKQAGTPSTDDDGMQYVVLDTMQIEAEDSPGQSESNNPYQPAKDRTWDLLHTILELSFDWKEEKVIGKATLALTPLFYAQDTLKLDAINFENLHIAIDDESISSFQNTGRTIIIPLGKEYVKNEKLTIVINYEVVPVATDVDASGAITSDKGLFFIDPQDTIPGLERQIWTQGETENSSRWFPTFDQPNERGTQEIILTVEDSMMTLSNGLLISSTQLADGMRRDHWKLDLPHAPYLAMIAVGQWDKVSEYWRGRPVDYYVDPGYGPSAKAIFQHTPEMIEFFSNRLGYDFVWPKYAQIIVKDFVSGAMENTTAVVFSDFVQFDKDDVIEDGINDYIVAHELFHHWFGDLVTCESWANLTLNEGFANYAEYLWQEHKYGKEQADISRMNELSGYFDQASYDVHPLIDYHYGDKQDMFDAHSYNKGGLVLHMLRNIVGDDAFFTSLQRYLKLHAYSAAEVDDLRQAFEEVIGKDLHWFFNQWYFGEGHPVLNVHHTYDAVQKQLTIAIDQVQDEQRFTPVFIIPLEVAIIQQNNEIVYHPFELNKKSQTFTFHLDAQPKAVVIDPHDVQLAVVDHDIPESEYAVRTLAPLSINHRLSAFRMMEEVDPVILDQLLGDTSYTMHLMIIDYLISMEDTERLHEIALKDTNPEFQFYILEALAETDQQKAMDVAMILLPNTDKVPMIYASLMAAAAVDLDEAVHLLAHVETNTSDAVFAAQTYILTRRGNIDSLDYFKSDRAAKIKDDYLEDIIASMSLYLSGEPGAVQEKGLQIIDSDFFLQTKQPIYRRFFLITGMLRQYAAEGNPVFQQKLMQTINSIYQKETNEYLRSVLKEGLGDLLD